MRVSVLQDEVLEALVSVECAGALVDHCHMFCLTTGRRESLELNS